MKGGCDGQKIEAMLVRDFAAYETAVRDSKTEEDKG
jgi:hypothetical protein